jgi:hypothetical protein
VIGPGPWSAAYGLLTRDFLEIDWITEIGYSKFWFNDGSSIGAVIAISKIYTREVLLFRKTI